MNFSTNGKAIRDMFFTFSIYSIGMANGHLAFYCATALTTISGGGGGAAHIVLEDILSGKKTLIN